MGSVWGHKGQHGDSGSQHGVNMGSFGDSMVRIWDRVGSALGSQSGQCGFSVGGIGETAW